MSSPPRLAARPRPRPPPAGSSPGSLSPPDVPAVPVRFAKESAECSKEFPIPACSSPRAAEDVATRGGHTQAWMDAAAHEGGVQATKFLTGHRVSEAAEVGATEGVRITLPDTFGASTGCPVTSPMPLTNRPSATPDGQATPTRLTTRPRHVAAFVTPSGPTLTRNGHLRQLLERIQASTAVRTSLCARGTPACRPEPICMPSNPSTQTTNLCSQVPAGPAPKNDKDTSASKAASLVCDVCGRRFTARRRLKKHARSHSLLWSSQRSAYENGSQATPPSGPHTKESPVCHHTRSRVAGARSGTDSVSSNTTKHLTYAEAVASSPRDVGTLRSSTTPPVGQPASPPGDVTTFLRTSTTPPACPPSSPPRDVTPTGNTSATVELSMTGLPAGSPPMSPPVLCPQRNVLPPPVLTPEDETDGSPSPRFIRTQNEDSYPDSPDHRTRRATARNSPSHVPECTLPAVPRQPDSPTVSAPTATSRVDQCLHLVFPVPDALPCTETGCRSTFVSNKWTQTRHSLIRHLLVAHNININITRRWCQYCSATLPDRPSRHPCLRDDGPVVHTGRTFRWKCQLCTFSCPTRGGFLNHEALHRRERARSSTTAMLLTTRSTDVRSIQTNASQDITVTLQRHLTNPNPMNGHPATQSTSAVESAPALPDVNSTPRRTLSVELPTRSHSASPMSPPDVSEHPEDPFRPTDNVDEQIQASSPLDVFVNQLAVFSASNINSEWDSFCHLLEDITRVASEVVRLPPPAEPAPTRPAPSILHDPRALQKLYRRNRRRAVRMLVEGETRRCTIGRDDIQDYFLSSQSTQRIDQTLYLAKTPPPPELDLAPFSPAEVAVKLNACENTAPGDDRLTYNHWKSVDPECRTLAAIFNVCLMAKRVPDAWKNSKTILLYKKGDPAIIQNWRPIALGRTLAKVFCGCLAKRLTAWILQNDGLSPSQKGFLPHDGVFENNYVVQQRLQYARSTKTELCLASLDLTDAFGSVPHEAIFTSLAKAGIGTGFLDIIKALYDQAATAYITAEGTTDLIPIVKGVRQGCPLSGLLFNLAIDPIVRALQGHAAEHRVLAYADDLLLLAPSPEELQVQLDVACSLSSKIGLRFNPRKCYTIHISGTTPIGTRPTTFNIAGHNIKKLDDGEAEDFLGKPIGFQLPPDTSALQAYIKACSAILESKLAPWQRIDALKSFIYPAMDFDMRTARLQKSAWKKVDDFVRPRLKKTLYVPSNAANEYLYGDPKSACIGFPLAAESSDIARIDGAFKLLTSRDHIVQELAWNDLQRLVEARTRRTVSSAILASFLSGSDDEIPRSTSNPISSVWSAARSASKRLHVLWNISDDHHVSITHDGITIYEGKRHLIFKTLRRNFRESRTAKLISYPNQGKAIECAAAAKASSHFIREGAFTRFADWRFIHRARLNLVPLNGANRRFTGNKGCRRCNHDLETLPHVLCHCMRYSRLYRSRHNAVVERIKKAAAGRWQIMSEDRMIDGQPLRPDLVLTNGDACIIIDVTIPFDNRRDAFDRARREKEEKYRPLVDSLKNRFSDVRVEAIVVGALGSWDPKNDRVVRRLCSRKYAALMRKLAVSDTIRFSRDIYVEHITGIRQNTAGSNTGGENRSNM